MNLKLLSPKHHRWFHYLGAAILLLALLTVQAASTHLTAADAQQNAMIDIQGAGTIGSNQIAIDIVGVNLANLGAFEFDLEMDATVATAQDAQVSAFLGSTGRTVGELTPIAGDQNEVIAFGAYSTGAMAGPSGALAQVTLTIVGEGFSPLTLANVICTDPQANVLDIQVAEDSGLFVFGLQPGTN